MKNKQAFTLLCHPELASGSSRSVQGFTLIELLVVVLIIGILAAVALPQYQKAVMKSRYSSLMLTAKAVADSNELYYLANNEYAEGVENLDVKVTNEESGVQVNVVGNTTTDYAYTIATRPNIKNNYIIYQKHSQNYPGEIHCEAENNNTQAQWVCATAYHGTKIEDNILTSGHTLYALEGSGVKSNTDTTSAQPEMSFEEGLCARTSFGEDCVVTCDGIDCNIGPRSGGVGSILCLLEGEICVDYYKEDGGGGHHLECLDNDSSGACIQWSDPQSGGGATN